MKTKTETNINPPKALSLMLLSFLLLSSSCIQVELKPINDSGEKYAVNGDELEYFEYLETKPRASTADGARLTALLLGQSPWYMNIEELRRFLIDKRGIKEKWEISEAAPLTRGKLAFMICYSAGITTSLVMNLTPRSERYAMREAVFHELIKPSNQFHYVSGRELMDAITKTETYMKKKESE